MYSRILVPLDASATAGHGLQEALRLAAQVHATLVLLNLVDDCPEQMARAPALALEASLEQAVEEGNALLAAACGHAAEAGVPCECVLREISEATAFEAIVEEAAARHCELIVMGTHGRRGLDRLAMGSDAEAVLRSSPVPVLLVRSPQKEA